MGWLKAFSPEQIFYIQSAVSVGGALLAVYFSVEISSGVTTRLFVTAGLILFGATAAIVYNRFVDPLNAMAEPSGGRQSLAEAIGEARLSFLGDIVDRVDRDRAESPSTGTARNLSEAGFEDLNVLVTSALICRDLISAQPKVRRLLGRFIIILAVALPFIVAIGTVVDSFVQDVQVALVVFITTFALGAYILLLAGTTGDLPNVGRWRGRVIQLRRIPYSEVKRTVLGWAEEDAGHG